MSHERVEYIYGAPINGNPPHDTIIWEYRGGGVIQVTYDRDGHVDSLATTSPSYRTASGIRVGMRIPLGRCHRLNGKCSYSWNGFTLVDTLNTIGGLHHEFQWSHSAKVGSGPVRARIQLFVGSNGLVSEVSMNRYLHCRWGDVVAPTCKPPPKPPQPAPPVGTRYCIRPGWPGNFLAATLDVTCTTALSVQTRVFSTACLKETRCDASGFTCLAYWDGRYDRPFEYTHHAICRAGPEWIEMDQG